MRNCYGTQLLWSQRMVIKSLHLHVIWYIWHILMQTIIYIKSQIETNCSPLKAEIKVRFTSWPRNRKLDNNRCGMNQCKVVQQW